MSEADRSRAAATNKAAANASSMRPPANAPASTGKRSATSRIAATTSVTARVWAQLMEARREVYMTSPYLVPGERGMEAFEELRARDVKVTLLTNSLAANDEPLVHGGYARYRERLLESGVDLYELSPARTTKNKRLGTFGTSLGRLHAKTAVLDRQKVLLGSVNLDPRSFSQVGSLGGMFFPGTDLARGSLVVADGIPSDPAVVPEPTSLARHGPDRRGDAHAPDRQGAESLSIDSALSVPTEIDWSAWASRRPAGQARRPRIAAPM